eukprot:TRINITY_DN5150_c0_g1_i3.p1 TRINITY_DN5150_c0_g1~~TRINITY_DN5150_c0_g1_i3.p1  ORF type:complete len:122 (-),score=43.95 TRINITY_DN5150_c0_g1_i3:125-490(-)
MGGAGRYRNMWPHYYESSDAVIFVVDSNDRLRMCVAKNEFDEMMENRGIAKRNIPVLVYANKNDIKSALTKPEVAQALDLSRIRDKPWHITSSCAITGDGLEEGLQWLTEQLLTAEQKASR